MFGTQRASVRLPSQNHARITSIRPVWCLKIWWRTRWPVCTIRWLPKKRKNKYWLKNRRSHVAITIVILKLVILIFKCSELNNKENLQHFWIQNRSLLFACQSFNINGSYIIQIHFWILERCREIQGAAVCCVNNRRVANYRLAYIQPSNFNWEIQNIWFLYWSNYSRIDRTN